MAMIDPNVMKAVGEVLESHGIKLQSGEGIADGLSRALGLSAAETLRWLESLNQGCTVEDANRPGGYQRSSRATASCRGGARGRLGARQSHRLELCHSQMEAQQNDHRLNCRPCHAPRAPFAAASAAKWRPSRRPPPLVP